MNLCIVEDNPTLLSNLRLLLDGEPGLKVLGAYASAEAALTSVSWEQCEALLVDIDLPGMSGVDLIQKLHPKHPHLQVLVHTISEDRDVVFSAIKAGAMGYLLKGSSPRELIESLHNLHLGGAPMSPRIARRILLEFQYQDKEISPHNLTGREIEVLKCVEKGMGYKEIAQFIGRSTHTVHAHIKKSYGKLQASDRQQALRKARSLGVL